MLPASPSRRDVLVGLLLLMLPGFALRAWDLELTPYNIDEAALSILASQIANLQDFPLVGIRTSYGFHNPPLLVWLNALPFRRTPDPRFAMLLFAMAGSAAIALVGLATRRLYGSWPALAAAAITAFSPNAIAHSRRLWGHDTIIFLSALCLYTAVRSIQTGRKKWMWVSLASAAAAQCCHLSGVFLWIVPLGALWLFHPAHRWKSLAVGAAVLFGLYLPWLIYDLQPWLAPGLVAEQDGRPLFSEITGMFRTALGAHGAASDSILPPILAWLTLLLDGSRNDALYDEYAHFIFQRRYFPPLFFATQGAFAALVAAGAATMLTIVKDGWRSSEERPAVDARWAAILLAAAVAPLLVFSLLPVEAVAPYQLPAFVPLVVAVACVLGRFGDIVEGFWQSPQGRWARLRRKVVTLPLLFIACGWMAAFGTLYCIKERHFLESADRTRKVNSVLAYKIDALSWIIGDAAGKPYSVVQDGRSEAAGLDFWVIYLHFYLSGNPTLPIDRSAPLLYVILDSKTVLRPEVEQWLQGRRGRNFGSLSVFRFEGEEAQRWREVVETYPSARL